MPESHERWQGLVALAAVDAVPADEAPELEAHLRGCPQCRSELEQLHDVTAAVHNAELHMTTGEEEPPTHLGERVVWVVAKARRSERLRSRAVAGIAAAAACLAFFAIGLAVPGPAGAPQEPVELVAAEGVDAQASLVAHTWGTEVKFVIEGLTDGEHYDVSFLAADGRRVSAGTFIGVGHRPVVCDMNAALLREDARRMEVAASDGEVVLAADVQRP